MWFISYLILKVTRFILKSKLNSNFGIEFKYFYRICSSNFKQGQHLIFFISSKSTNSKDKAYQDNGVREWYPIIFSIIKGKDFKVFCQEIYFTVSSVWRIMSDVRCFVSCHLFSPNSLYNFAPLLPNVTNIYTGSGGKYISYNGNTTYTLGKLEILLQSEYEPIVPWP